MDDESFSTLPILFQEDDDGMFINPLVLAIRKGDKLTEVTVEELFMDGGEPCLVVTAIAGDTTYKVRAMWLGSEELRLFYQAEANQKGRGKLARFIHEYCQE